MLGPLPLGLEMWTLRRRNVLSAYARKERLGFTNFSN